ncbi:LuxR C-terminal-related transcriptional regulator [Saccharopolyspora sp. ASAGF58]|uniref:helix-turn-helix transcriptional regulator n=1 Tax=Saccharopolyspora sp. ASAGF58 TaxID=2719023 RepID=UPI001444D130|nr:LuxR C-terminal-related transcriptional regulator [Saccharopolyspora sp. ASAGF58]
MSGSPGDRSAAEKIIEAAETLAAASSIEELQRLAMDTVAKLLPARSHAIYLLDPNTGTPVSSLTQGASDVFLARYEEIGRTSDPLLRHCVSSSSVAHSSRLLGENAWLAEPVYRDVMALHGWKMVLEAPVVAGSTVLGTLNVADRDSAALASDGDLVVAAGIGRVVGMATAGLMQRGGLQRERDSLVAAFELSTDALIITDHRTGDRLLNAAARSQLERVAPGASREWLEDAMAASSGSDEPGTAEYVIPRGDQQIVASLRTVLVAEGSNMSVSVLRVRGDLLGSQVNLPPSLAGLLSPREREVACLAVAGLRDDQIAAKVFLSRYTVKQHLRSVYRKLGIDSRTALTRLALGGS